MKHLDQDHNILDKEKKDKIITPRGTSLDKVNRYAWFSESRPGVFMEIEKHRLNIDGRYQREKISNDKVLTIASEWDWKLFNAISAIRREDGSLWVFDGGHRVRASFYRSDILYLPCMVFDACGVENEAKAFVAAGTMKTNISAHHRFKASICAKEPITLKTKAILDKHGYVASKSDNNKFGFQAISTLVKIVKEDSQLADKVFESCAMIANEDEQITSSVLAGLFLLAKRLNGKVDILASAYVNKLAKKGMAFINVAINREKHIMGIGGARVSAKAILDILNHGKRKKIKMPE